MSDSISIPRPVGNCTNYAWTEAQLAAGYEAQGATATITALDSVMWNQTFNRCDIAEKAGVITAQTYAIAAAGG